MDIKSKSDAVPYRADEESNKRQDNKRKLGSPRGPDLPESSYSRASTSPPSRAEAPAHIQPDIVQHIFSHIDPEDTATFRAARQAAPALKDAIAQALPWVEANLARFETTKFLENLNARKMSPALREILPRTTQLDLSELDIRDEDNPQIESASRHKLSEVLTMAKNVKKLTLPGVFSAPSANYWVIPVEGMKQLESLDFGPYNDLQPQDFRGLADIVNRNDNLVAIQNIDIVPTSQATAQQPKTLLESLLEALKSRSNIENLTFNDSIHDPDRIYEFSQNEVEAYKIFLLKNPNQQAMYIRPSKEACVNNQDLTHQLFSIGGKLKNLRDLYIRFGSITGDLSESLSKEKLPFPALELLRFAGLFFDRPKDLRLAAQVITATPNVKEIKIDNASFFYPPNHYIPAPATQSATINTDIESFMTAMSLCQNLKTIAMYIESLPAQAVSQLMSLLPRHRTVKQIDLAFKHLTQSGVDLLIENFGALSNLEEVALHFANITGVDAVKLSSKFGLLKETKELQLTLENRIAATELIYISMCGLQMPSLSALRVNFYGNNPATDMSQELKMSIEALYAARGVDFSWSL